MKRWGFLLLVVCAFLTGGCGDSGKSGNGSDSASGAEDTDFELPQKSDVQKILIKETRHTNSAEDENYAATNIYEYEYDSSGNLCRKNITGDNEGYYIYTYNDSGQMTDNLYHTDDYELIYEYAYDTDGRIMGICMEGTNWDSKEFTYTYDDAGNMTEETCNGQISSEWEYDEFDRLIKYTSYEEDGSVAWWYEYSYDSSDEESGDTQNYHKQVAEEMLSDEGTTAHLWLIYKPTSVLYYSHDSVEDTPFTLVNEHKYTYDKNGQVVSDIYTDEEGGSTTYVYERTFDKDTRTVTCIENIKFDGDEDFIPGETKETVYDEDGYVTRETEISDGVKIRETVYEWEN